MRELGSTEEVITEKKQVNSNIELQNIYDAIRYLKPEQQRIILSTFKLTELYSIFADNESYKKYVNDLYAVSNEYVNRAIALSSLHTEALLQSMGKQKFDILDTMETAYDSLPDMYKKIFCENMMGKSGFFQDAYKMMMDSFESAKEKESGDKAVHEKMENRVEN